MVVLPLGVALSFMPRAVGWPGGSLGAIAAAGALYAAAHGVRALRLALLGAPALQVPVRSLVLLHFHAAPVSFAVPLKLGELYRLQQLIRLASDPGGAVVVLLLERSFDAAVLLLALVSVLLFTGGLPHGALGLALVLGPLTLAGGGLVLLAPGGLAAVQAYVLRHHSGAASLRLLRPLDAARLTTGRAHGLVRRMGVVLLLLSAAIWGLESIVVAVLASVVAPELPGGLAWLSVAGMAGAGGLAGAYAVVGYWCLMLLWPGATALYLWWIGRRMGLRARVAAAGPMGATGVRRIRLAGRVP